MRSRDLSAPAPLTMNTDTKYLAVKIQGIQHWLWFERAKTVRAAGQFSGHDGWGKGGTPTEIITDEKLIEAEIASDQLQYG